MDESREARRSETRRVAPADRILLLLAATTLVLGIWGFTTHAPQSDHCDGLGKWWFFDWLYRTIALFEPSEANVRLGECYPYKQIAVARFTGITAFVVGAGRVVLQLFRGPISNWNLSRSRNHSVFLGFGEIGQIRAIERAEEGKRVVAVDASSSEVLTDIAARHGILLVRGEARAPAVLAQARVDHAAEVTVALGDDTQNLAAAQFLASRWQTRVPGSRRIEVSLTSPLIRRALSWPDRAVVVLEVLSVEDRAAWRLCQTARFFEIADLLGQRRIHIVFAGFAPITPIIATHLLQSCAVADFDRPLLTILTPDPDGARNQLLLDHPGIDQLADLSFVAGDPLQRPVDLDDLMPTVAATAPVTAVLVSTAHSSMNQRTALAIREAVNRSGWWRAPIFLGADRVAASRDGNNPVETVRRFARLRHLAHAIGAAVTRSRWRGAVVVPDANQTALSRGIDHAIETTRRFSEVLHSFETSAHLITRKATEARDKMAKEIHEGYCKAFQRMTAEGEKPSQGGEAVVPWKNLAHTYRQANRRVADHLPAKLASAGCYVPLNVIDVPEGFNLLAQPGMLDRLAALEHQAWMAERLLDGWRYAAVRDNASRLHNDLVPFDQLPPETQELDRVQIRDLNFGRLPRRHTPDDANTPLVRFDLWIGLIGQPGLTQEQAEWVKTALQSNVLPELLKTHRDHHVSLLSPLAPGADLVLTEAALEFLSANPRQHRLLVTEAVPIRDVVDDFEASWRLGAAGCLDPAARKATWPDARDALLERIRALEGNARCERILELYGPPPAVDPTRILGYQRQNAYLVQRAHVIIAAVAGATTAQPGGTGEALTWRRDHATIPDTMPRYLPRPNRPAEGTPRLIVLDARQREVRPNGPAA